MRLLDLFCGAGGCSVGYNRAGFDDITGIDIKPQKNYPFKFIQGDALEYLKEHGHEYDAIHASPPCQRYSKTAAIRSSGESHPDLVGPTRELLERTGKPWVIENVPGAPLVRPIILCGQMFGLGVIRHRLFESTVPLMSPGCPGHPKGMTTGTRSWRRGGRGNGYSTGSHGLVCVAGKGFNRAAGASAIGIDWMKTQQELAQAIPPEYTEYIGRQLIAHVRGKA